MVMFPSPSLIATRLSFSNRPSSEASGSIGSGCEQLAANEKIMIAVMKVQAEMPRISLIFLFIIGRVFCFQIADDLCKFRL